MDISHARPVHRANVESCIQGIVIMLTCCAWRCAFFRMCVFPGDFRSNPWNHHLRVGGSSPSSATAPVAQAAPVPANSVHFRPLRLPSAPDFTPSFEPDNKIRNVMPQPTSLLSTIIFSSETLFTDNWAATSTQLSNTIESGLERPRITAALR